MFTPQYTYSSHKGSNTVIVHVFHYVFIIVRHRKECLMQTMHVVIYLLIVLRLCVCTDDCNILYHELNTNERWNSDI